MKPKITLVTGLWDLGRSELTPGWARSFQEYYIPYFKQLLNVPFNLIVFGPSELEDIVWNQRSKHNTVFIHRDKTWFHNEFYDSIQKIRLNENWYKQATWLEDSTQAKLDLYNPVVMSKMFLLNDARLLDTFDSSHLFWIDAGIPSAVSMELLSDQDSWYYFCSKLRNFFFLNYPYDAEAEVHGFEYDQLNRIAGRKVLEVSRGGFFGGRKEVIQELNLEYYALLSYTLGRGLMGTEESIFSIMTYKFPELIEYFLLEKDGLGFRFFEAIKNRNLQLQDKKLTSDIFLNPNKFAIYTLTYNSPSQFETLCKSFELYDKRFLKAPEKYLLNNSLDESTFEEYDKICKKYGFLQIKKDNIGISGGRQFIAEHFHTYSKCDYYMFFEDDMFMYVGSDETCELGFNRKIKDLCTKALQIANNENLDFLKLNFKEFFGDNRYQWAWQNLTVETRKSLFPKNKYRSTGTMREVPKTVFSNINSYKGLPYALGEVYYCNWPQIVSRVGNRKMFIDKKWYAPDERVWMAHFYEETIKGNLKPGILLATPTEHDRFDHYPEEERREN